MNHEVNKGEATLWDVVIIGGGPAGLTAGLYAGRAQMKTLLLENAAPGGQIFSTWTVENYPGFPDPISGPDLSKLFEDHATRWGTEIRYEEAAGISVEDGRVVIATGKAPIRARTAIITTGAHPRYLGVPGEKEYFGRGVSYCAVCDGALFKGKELVVVGGGDSALEESLFLTRYATRLTIVHRRNDFRGSKHLQTRTQQHEKINFVLDSVVEEIKGGELVEKVVVRNVKTGEKSEIKTDGVFVYIGMVPNTDFLKGSVNLNELGYVQTDENFMTNLPGVFAAGDVRGHGLAQIVTAAAEGALAAMSAEKYVAERE